MFWLNGLKEPLGYNILKNVGKSARISCRKGSIYKSFFQTLNMFSKSKKFKSDITMEVAPYKCHQLEGGPDTSVTVTKEEALRYYEQMMMIRQIENVSAVLYREKSIRGFCHLYSGQEGVAVGIKAAMGKKDNVITSYRAHGWTYLMGVSLLGVLAELTGRETGCARGKGGSMHMYAPHFYGGNGIVGAQVPLGTGIAFASKYRGESAVCITCYGDGAANQGQIAESFNMAGLFNLPVVYVCENNRYGMGTASKRSSFNADYYTRGDLIPGLWVDGMDVLAVRNATGFAIEYALKNGPIILETYTYRYGGHSMSDPGVGYRTREEVQEVRDKQDPIVHFRKRCLEAGLASDEEFKKIDDKVKGEVNAAAEQSKKDKEISLEELSFDLYCKFISDYVRGPSGQKLKHQLKGKPVNI